MFTFNHRTDTPIEPVFHSHSYYEVYYFHEGKCNYLIGDQIYTLSPGDLIIMYGMTLHCAKIDPAYPYIRSIIHFDPSLLRPYLEPPHAINVLEPFQQFKNYRLCLRGEDKEEAERILSLMHKHQERHDEIGDSRRMLAFVDLLHFVYERCLQPLRQQREFPSEKEKAVQDVIALLETTFTEDLHMDQLQKTLHLSKSYLAKIFKEVTGVTIFEYVYRKRINEARILFLLHPGMTVTEACFRLGFKHLAHFSRLFKQMTGLSPDQFKKQARNNNLQEKEAGFSEWKR
ncbi:AraC family transcriptional regulator [Cohnella yongneupensis]|uniref:AraC family transcriptional regulator n=1 Tax=Cohnella yongneupensis TaxID=425006 RepID=A0ABW0R2X2_9BACL